MKVVSLTSAPLNAKVSINDKKVKCIKHEDKTWVNVNDFTDKSNDEINYFFDKHPDIKEHAMKFNYWGTIEYYIEGAHGLTLLHKQIKKDSFWY